LIEELKDDDDRFWISIKNFILKKSYTDSNIIEMLIIFTSPEIDIYDNLVFQKAESLSVRHYQYFRNEEFPLIPVYPKIIRRFKSPEIIKKMEELEKAINSVESF